MHTSTLDQVVDRSMRINIIAGVLGMVWMSVALGMPLPLLMQAVGASGFQLGLLAAAWQIGMLAQIPCALIVDRLRARKPFWALVSGIHRALWGVPALLPLVLPQRTDLWPIVIITALAISNILGQGGTAPWQSWMADLIPADRAGHFWGVRHRLLSLGLIASALASGVALDAFSSTVNPYAGFQLVFAAAAIFGIGDILLHCAVWEPVPAALPRDQTSWERICAPLRDRDFRLLTFGMGAWAAAQAFAGYTMGLPGFFSVVYLKEAFGATYAQATWVFIASAIGAVLWAPAIGRWVDRAGAQRVTAWLLAAGPALMSGWLMLGPGRWQAPGLGPVPHAVILMSALSLVIGGIYAGLLMCQYRLTQALTQPSGRTLAMAVHWSIVGLIGASGPLLGGWIKDHFPDTGMLLPGGAPFSYFQVLVLLHIATAWGIALPLITRIRPGPSGS